MESESKPRQQSLFGTSLSADDEVLKVLQRATARYGKNIEDYFSAVSSLYRPSSAESPDRAALGLANLEAQRNARSSR